MELLLQLDPTGQVCLVLISLALGALVGLRREMEMQEQGIPGFVGLRTMPLVVLLGTISTFFPLFPWMPVVTLGALIGFLGIAYYNGVFQLQLLGLTSELATLIMFMVGILVGYGHIPQALVITVFVAIFSAFKNQLHSFAGTISSEEWTGSLQLLIISAIVLPILPQTAIDPWGALVPYNIWLVVIFVSAIGFVGYFLNKYFGKQKSVLLTSVLGSFVSSTVVTTGLAIQSRKDTENKNTVLFVSGISIAIITMLARVTLVMAALTPAEYMFQVMVVPLGMLVMATLMGIYWYFRSRNEVRTMNTEIKVNKKIEQITEPEISSPFELVPALQFAVLFVIVLLGVQLGQIYFGNYGAIITTFFSAFADVDAAIISVLEALKNGNIEISLVTLVTTIALVVNTMVKALYVWLLSRKPKLSLSVLFITTVVSLAGIVTYLAIAL